MVRSLYFKQLINLQFNYYFPLFFQEKMKKKIFIHVAGNTLKSHEKIIKKLEKRGAKKVESLEQSEATIVFCPIVSRFETDVKAALSSAEGKREETLMHVKNPVMFCPIDAIFDLCFLSVTKN